MVAAAAHVLAAQHLRASHSMALAAIKQAAAQQLQVAQALATGSSTKAAPPPNVGTLLDILA